MEETKAGDESVVRRRVLYVSAGASHTVALLSDNLVCSWGRGEDGQLGHGDAEDRHCPVIISALSDCEISSITCGADHTVACSESTLTVYSWGWGDFGRLGHGNSTDLFVPQPVKALQERQIKQVACGDSHCLAITEDGEVFSWGRNQNGQLGHGNTEDSLLPQKILAFEGTPIKMLAAGAEHTAAVSENGKLFGWGWGRYGNLGLGDRNDRFIPAEVAAIPGEMMSMVACGWRHTITVSGSGNLYTYGWSKYGQLGQGNYDDHLMPHQVASLRNQHVIQISGGWRHTMALIEEGKLYSWGWNKFGQLGVGDTNNHCSPQMVQTPADEKIIQVSCGWRHTIAITERYNIFSWGRGTCGQIGHGDTIDRLVPKRLEALSADGLACQHIERAQLIGTAAHWISPAERYAVVPDEMVSSLSGRLNQTANVDEELVVPSSFPSAEVDASVPDTDFKRPRTE